MKRNTVLIIIFVLLMAASGLLLYRGLNDQAITIIPSTVNDRDVIIRNQIDRLDVRLKSALNKIDQNGDLDALIKGKQFQELDLRFVREIEIGPSGRSNPFLPFKRDQE